MKIIRPLFAVLLAMVLILGVSTAAFAGPGEWNTGDKGDGPTEPKTKTKPGAPPGSGEPASGTSGTWANSGIVWGNPTSKMVFAPDPQAPSSNTRMLLCGGGNKWGKYLGMRWNSWGIRTTDGTSDVGSYRYYSLSGASRTCVDRPHYIIQIRHCVTKISGSVKFAYKNVKRIPVKTVKLATTTTPFASSGGKNLSKCSSEYAAKYQYLGDLWGQYNGLADAWERIATVRHYTTPNAKTGVTPPDVLLALGAERKVNPVSVWWTQSCHGIEQGRISRSFDGNDCRDAPDRATRWTCGLREADYPYLTGVRNNSAISVYHDGRKRDIVWKAQPKLGGNVKNVSDKKVRLIYKKGTPFRKGSAVDAPDQHFLTTPAMGAYTSGWDAKGTAGETIFIGQFFKSGMPGDNLMLAPVWRFTAKFKHVSPGAPSVTSGGKLVFTKPVTSWAKSTGSCEGVPTNLRIVRSRISN